MGSCSTTKDERTSDRRRKRPWFTLLGEGPSSQLSKRNELPVVDRAILHAVQGDSGDRGHGIPGGSDHGSRLVEACADGRAVLDGLACVKVATERERPIARLQDSQGILEIRDGVTEHRAPGNLDE